MVKHPSTVIHDSHDVGVIVFVVIVKWIKDDAQTDPPVWAAKHLSIIRSFRLCVPECLQQRTSSLYDTPLTYYQSATG